MMLTGPGKLLATCLMVVVLSGRMTWQQIFEMGVGQSGDQGSIGSAIGSDQGGSLDFLSGFRANQGMSRAQGQRFQMTSRGFQDIDWMKIDRRAEEGWWHLYPFGERFNDLDISLRPWNDQQIDLDFFFPFFGFRFNYTFIFPEGFVAFAYPNYIQPPYTFPTPGWPRKHDPSLIAAFMSEQSLMHIGESRISHVWYRVIQRPINFIGRDDKYQFGTDSQSTFYDSNSNVKGRAAVAGQSTLYRGQLLKQAPGRVEDPQFLDELTRDIRHSMVGARGFTADYALLVTWERMGYGGTPKSTKLNEYEQVKRSVGFNGGNGTGFVNLPYSAEGNSYKLVQFGSTQTSGRWLARVDETMEYGGCTNDSTVQPDRGRTDVELLNDPIHLANNWMHPSAENLTLKWSSLNVTTNPNAQVDITLWGYWEDVEGHQLTEVGSIARKTQNTGAYSFNPRTLAKTDMMRDAWRRFQGGVVQVRVADNWMSDRGDGLYWSRPISFSWYFRQIWEHEYGRNWALDICRDWFSYDGKRRNFIMELEPKISCPCTLGQAEADFGRFTPLFGCNAHGNSECRYTKGAWHCVISSQSVWTGAGQMCCYDREGWLMFSDDFEYNDQYLRFYAAGFPMRAHPWGSYPYKRPPYVPTLSNFFNDLLPYEYCCKWAGKCEFFYWRRQSSGCQEYRHPKLGFAYGQSHFITYDGLRYPFHGKGYYVLSMMKGPRRDMMIQVRMEQPPRTIWNEEVRATVITGLAARDNQSATVQVFARKEFRRWRYKMDVYIDGNQIFFDVPYKKLQNFPGVTLFSPDRNMNTSEIHIMFTTGVGIKVTEARGLLNIAVAVPPSYNESLSNPHLYDRFAVPTGAEKCSKYTRTMGLLGTFNDDPSDELVTPDCHTLSAGGGIGRIVTESESRNVYLDFGEKWVVDGGRDQLLFQLERLPLYDPNAFAARNYTPVFDTTQRRAGDFYQSLIFDRNQVKVACQGVPSCEFDYISSGRKETAMETLSAEKKFEGDKIRGEKKLISCGPLVKNKGVIKYPIGNNYLDGVTVTFTCKPKYFLHGEEQRHCINGTWSPGWWAWCRDRNLEIALKWLTGISITLIIIAIIASIFLWCYCMRVKGQKTNQARIYRQPAPAQLTTAKLAYAAPPAPREVNYTRPVLPVVEMEPAKVGLHTPTPNGYSETSA